MRFLVMFLINAMTLQIQNLQIDSPVENIAWCGASLIYTKEDESVPQSTTINQEKVVFIQTESEKVYQTNGTSWTQIEEKFTEMQISPANSHVIYMFGEKSFRSDNCGEDFVTINTEGLSNFKLNKMNPKHILAFRRIKCEPKDIDCRDSYDQELHISLDGGLTWVKSFSYVREASWDKKIEDLDVPDDRVVICLSVDGQSQVSYSDDFLNLQPLYQGGQIYFQTAEYLFILVQDKESYKLYFGESHLHKFEIRPVQLPIQIYKEFSYTILDTDKGRICMAVSHQQSDQQITNIYFSNYEGDDFKLALTNNVRSIDSGNCDFEKLLGLESVYIANIFDDKNKRTVISFDNGEKWQSIKAPEKDSKGEETLCYEECSLHLIGRTQSYKSGIYTSEQAPGIAISVGNIGSSLHQSDYNTYMTNDGGQSWFEIKKGSYVNEMTDHGSLIVIAPDDEPTNQISYSTDYGKSWQQKVIYDEDFIVTNIVTEVSGQERFFLVYGKDDQRKGIALKVDFSDLFVRECKEQDYEYWAQQCSLGRQTQYKRRKATSKCFNPQRLDLQQIKITNCPCTNDDWVCETYKDPETGECISSEQDNICVPGKPYLEYRGYKKVTNCQGGVDLGPIERVCPGGSYDDLILFSFVCLIVVIVIVFAYSNLQRKPDIKKQKVEQFGYDNLEIVEDDNML